jgi:hypothetical protein
VPAGKTRRGFWGRRSGARRAFTLVEAMVATTVFTMVTLGVYSMLIKSYQLAALTRCRDDARGVLRTFADQFERLQTTELVGSTTYNRWLFNPTGGPSGRGIRWGSLSDDNTSTAAPDVVSLAITLGGAGHPTPATLTRDVRYVDASTGATSSTQAIQAAGFMLQGTFTINFSRNGKSYSQSLTVLRVAP